MPYTRQRPDGTNETQSHTLLDHHTQIITAGPLAVPTASTQSRYIHRNTSAVPTLIIAAVAAVFSLWQPQEAQARPARTQAAQPTGTWGWTSGSQTYLRARPSAKTPPVAKVATHSKLFVWGKYDGWYRVETTDHVFGWVYNSYLNVPEKGKVKELSHAKAKLASDRTGHQMMYGSKELLTRYYSQYGAAGAVRGLKNHGVTIAAAPKKATAPRPGAKAPVKSSPRVVQTKPGQSRVARTAAPRSAAPRANAPRPVILAAIPDPSFNDVGNVHLSPSASGAKRTERWGSRSNSTRLPLESRIDTPGSSVEPGNDVATGDTRAITPSFAPEVAAAPAITPKPVQADNKAQEQAKTRAAKAAAAKAEAAKVEAARVAAVRAEAQRVARVRLAQENARKAAAAKAVAAKQAANQRRLAEARKAENSRQSARQKRIAQRRDQIRRSMGNAGTAAPPIVGPDLRPLSPEELLNARNAFLANQKQNGTSDGITVAPSAFNPVTTARGNTIPTVAPAPKAPVAVKISSARPSTKPAAKSTPPSRGGSPRDYAAYAQKQQKSFGQGLADGALAYRGMPYIYGASNPSRGFDCSGLVNHVLRQRGYNPPRTAAGLASFGTAVSKSDLKPGDLLFFGSRRHISHVGIYMGNNKMIHAANPRRGVRVDSINSGYYASKYAGARRVK